MFRPFSLLIVIVAVIALPDALHAQSRDDFPIHGGGPGMIRPPAGAPSPRTSPAPPYVYASTLWSEGPPRMAIDYRLPPKGLVGSAGYLNVGAGRAPDIHEAGIGASARFSGQGGFVGAMLTYAFR